MKKVIFSLMLFYFESRESLYYFPTLYEGSALSCLVVIEFPRWQRMRIYFVIQVWIFELWRYNFVCITVKCLPRHDECSARHACTCSVVRIHFHATKLAAKFFKFVRISHPETLLLHKHKSYHVNILNSTKIHVHLNAMSRSHFRFHM